MTPLELAAQIQNRFGAWVDGPTEFRGEATLVVRDPERIVEVCRYAKEDQGYNLLLDITGIDHLGEDPRWSVVYELYGIAAAVLGGCSLRGGEGSVVGILIGTALLQVLRNLVNLLGIPSSLDLAVMGAVILIGVIADQYFTARRNRRQVERMRAATATTESPIN